MQLRTESMATATIFGIFTISSLLDLSSLNTNAADEDKPPDLVNVSIKNKAAVVLYIVMDEEMLKDNPNPRGKHVGHGIKDRKIDQKEHGCAFGCRMKSYWNKVIELAVGAGVENLKVRRGKEIDLEAAWGVGLKFNVKDGRKVSCKGWTGHFWCD